MRRSVVFAAGRWMIPAVISIAGGTLAITFVSLAAARAGAAGEALPGKTLIGGVPFVSYYEAAGFKYSTKDILNPTAPACYAMVSRFWGWGDKFLRSKDWKKALDKAEVTGGEARSFEELKPHLDKGFPVLVMNTITPHAHYLNPPVAMLLSFQKNKDVDVEALEKKDLSTRLLGRMLSLENFRKIKVEGMDRPIRESVYDAWRVVVGYDDQRRVATLHDPSFGPAWEVGYDEFEAMWEPMGRLYTVVRPKDAPEAAGPTVSPYRERTAAERAARCFVYGYALAAIGRAADAEAELKIGLALPEAGKGYQHLFLAELASLDFEAGRFAACVEKGQQASDLLPENPMIWSLLKSAYEKWGGHSDEVRDAERKGNEARSKLGKGDALVRVLPTDFYMQGIASFRGWGGEPDRLERGGR